MKKLVTGFVAGVVVSTSVSIYANGVIKKAEYNDVKVSFNGVALELKESLINVQKDGEDTATNYMPVRDVLEGMGYTVSWNGGANVIEVTDKVIDVNNVGSNDSVNEDEWIYTDTLKSMLIFDKIDTSPDTYSAFMDRSDEKPIFESKLGDSNNIVRMIKDNGKFILNKEDLQKLGIEIE